MPFTVQMTGTNEISPAILQVLGASFDAPLRSRLYDQLSLKQLASSSDKTVFSFGKIAPISLSGGLPTLSEYEDPNSVALSGGKTDLTAVEMGIVVTTTARADAISGGNLGRQAAAAVGDHAARTLDLYAASVLAAGTNAAYVGAGTSVGITSADIMTAQVMNRAYAHLMKNNAVKDANGFFTAMLTTDQILDLKNSAGAGSWTDVLKYGNSTEVMAGEVGRAFGFKVIEINLLTAIAGGSGGAVPMSKAVFFGANALGQGVTKAPTLGIAFTDKMGRFAHYSWHALMILGIIDQAAVYVVSTAVTTVA